MELPDKMPPPDPTTLRASGLLEALAPKCPVHGKMTFAKGSTEGCFIVAIGLSDVCACEPGEFRCAGWDGEGCDAPPVSMADYLKGLGQP